MKNLAYIAQPFSHPDPDVRKKRGQWAEEISATLMAMQIPAFVPIAHSWRGDMLLESWVAKNPDMEYFMQVDLPIIEHCCKVLAVIMMPGWTESKGVVREIQTAANQGIPIIHIPFEFDLKGDASLDLEPLKKAMAA